MYKAGIMSGALHLNQYFYLKIIHRLNFLIKSNFFVAICAASLLAQTFVLFDLVFHYKLISCVFLATIFIYCFHRLVKFYKSNKYFFISQLVKDQKLLVVMTLLSLACLIPLILTLELNSIVFFLFIGLVTIWYSLGFFRIRSLFINLRNIPYLKLFVIAFVWSMMTAALPLLNEEKSMKFYLIVLERFVFILVITIPFDIRDIKIDEQEGLKTLPIVLGIKKAKVVCFGLICLFVCIVLFVFFNGFHTKQITVALLVSGLITLLMIFETHAQRPFYFYSLGMEGLSLLQSMLVFMTLLF